ncbi:hypothetical protein SARC_11224 [Sphaeroforma arctica JP610]|uniref:MYND-type domain-containing protein n=1 Tax=Sphaeroforma arctica JP610 TaxID=667725 RepID=A0A0L0FJR2_9EUKA|nr:hypothetical protein SARC_11224 [Sphaeroforma arctica JP610]KNC76268.1 hypothetical protein SARC_11224 [Sphaeroforma arctica JP610]|eukprot:XP_014150170.1 hypothetical protein SARC_11224 [Sphaeroforma arctica JP610]
MITLMPDHNLRDLAHAATGITRILKRLAAAEDIRELYFEDAVRTRALVASRRLKKRSGPYTYMVLHKDVPQIIEFQNPRRDTEALATMREYIAQGHAYEANVFHVITDLEYYSWMLVAVVTDEVATNVFNREARLVIGNITLCNNCGAAPVGSNNLLRCANCRMANYCNAQCQKDHWQTHKSECRRNLIDDTLDPELD